MKLQTFFKKKDQREKYDSTIICLYRHLYAYIYSKHFLRISLGHKYDSKNIKVETAIAMFFNRCVAIKIAVFLKNFLHKYYSAWIKGGFKLHRAA